MRKYLGLAVLTGAVGALAVGCGTKGSGGATIRQGTGSTGSGANSSGGAGSIFNPGSGGNSIFDPGMQPTNYGGAPADPEPGNPNVTHADCQPGACLDFPEAPIMGEGVPTNAPTLFGDPMNFTDGGLCVLEPQLGAGGKPGAMLPSNWVRPRFRVGGVPAGIDLLEIRIHSAAEAHDLVAYTKYVPSGGVAPSWYLPKEIWNGKVPADMAATPRPSGYGFANNAAGQSITVTIRGINSASPGKPVGATGELNIAPVVATGSMVFWTVNSGKVTADSSKLLGFAVGDEGVASALTLKDVKWTGEIGEDGAVLRGFYDKEPLKDFQNGDVRCIGCHVTIPPDANGSASVLFGDDWPWSLAGAQLNGGAIPTALAAGAQAIMKTPWWGQQHMSIGHWATGDHTIISSYGSTFMSGKARTIPWEKLPAYNGTDGATADDKIKWHQLAWINADYNASIPVTISAGNDYGKPELDMRNTMVTSAKGTGWGIIATGDKNVSDVSPNLSHDGNTIVYVTSDYTPDGHPDATATVADVRTVPYANRAGGTSAPLAGASDANMLEYYPSFSQDDKLIAFTQAPKPSTASPDGPYYNRNGKIMVIPAAGGTATELVANDPGTCGGDNVSAGIINSWPKWSPDAVPVKANNKTYYFLVFSSARKYGDEFSKQFDLEVNTASSFKGLPHSSQLYLAAVVVDNMTGAITTYPAVYIWNQNRTPGANGTTATGLQYSNLTPAWDPIKLPDLMIPDVPIETIPK
ncbi:MAG TPA: hypothetical protein VER96_41950 [Polyangiaceae bacterium]|nr:hypothetical protein [Polyangiaceae bacterium]